MGERERGMGERRTKDVRERGAAQLFKQAKYAHLYAVEVHVHILYIYCWSVGWKHLKFSSLLDDVQYFMSYYTT